MQLLINSTCMVMFALLMTTDEFELRMQGSLPVWTLHLG